MTVTFQQPAAGQFRPALEGTAGTIATEVTDMVKHAAAWAPRSQQRAAGPSELGTPCTRRLGYRLTDHDPKPNSDTDPWASVIGTSVHAWMADIYTAENRHLGRERYLVERRIWLPGGIKGSLDLYDRDICAVIDWKVVGLDPLKKYRRDGPGPQYRTQFHLYGLGMQLAGETPQHVAGAFLPRGGRIDGLHVWSEPYDPQVAVQALKRLQALREFHITLDPENNPAHWSLLATADAHCAYCPFYLPGSADLSKGCPGHQEAK
jgi:hypothetical protein